MSYAKRERIECDEVEDGRWKSEKSELEIEK